jgi:hypothetical protein
MPRVAVTVEEEAFIRERIARFSALRTSSGNSRTFVSTQRFHFT